MTNQDRYELYIDKCDREEMMPLSYDLYFSELIDYQCEYGEEVEEIKYI